MRAIKHWDNIAEDMVDLSSLKSLIQAQTPFKKSRGNSARSYGLGAGIIGNLMASLFRPFLMIVVALLPVSNPLLAASSVHVAEL